MTASPGQKPGKPDGRLMLSAGTLFCAAALSFSIQPLMGKMLLPFVGGSPSVWLVALAFFQIALLAGYALAYILSRQTRIVQFSATLALLVAGLGVLPPHLAEGMITPGNGRESLSVLLALCATLAIPFIALTSLTPGLQRLLAESGARGAPNPYLLFAASNLGSFAGLLSYPLWFERHMGLSQQSRLWQQGYALTLALACLSLAIALREPRRGASATTSCLASPPSPPPASPPQLASEPAVAAVSAAVSAAAAAPPPPQQQEQQEQQKQQQRLQPADAPNPHWKQRAKWILLAFLPASLMMGVTEQISQEASYPPIFRILPLAVYLLTLVTAFARQRDGLLTKLLRGLQPVAVILEVANVVAAPYDTGLSLTAPLFGLIAFWPTAVLCHNRLASHRPDSARLSEYYLCLAAGGAMGGILNAFLAPLLFPIPVEFILVLLVATWALFPASSPAKQPFWKRKLFWIAALVVCVAAGFPLWAPLLDQTHADPARFGLALLALLVALLTSARQPRGLVALSCLGIALAFLFPEQPRPRAIERNFFGVVRVQDLSGEDGSVYRVLLNGATPQSIVKIAPEFGLAPVAAFGKTGILGNLGELARLPTVKRIGIAGFGAGAFLCAFPKDKEFTGIDINPATFRLSAKWFDILDRCAYPKIVVGDARLSLQNDPNAKYDLLIFDVFYGTALPMHLLTREAFKIYFDRLNPGGLLAFHVYNPHYDLRQTLGDMAAAFGAKAFSRQPILQSPEKLWGQSRWNPTPWIAMTRDDTMASALRAMEWQDVPPLGFEPMTDDFNDSISLQKDTSHAQTR